MSFIGKLNNKNLVIKFCQIENLRFAHHIIGSFSACLLIDWIKLLSYSLHSNIIKLNEIYCSKKG